MIAYSEDYLNIPLNIDHCLSLHTNLYWTLQNIVVERIHNTILQKFGLDEVCHFQRQMENHNLSVKLTILNFPEQYRYNSFILFASFTRESNIVLLMLNILNFVVVTNYNKRKIFWDFTLRKKCPYSELFCTAFFPRFPGFELNTERYFVCLRIQSECGKMREKCGPE